MSPGLRGVPDTGHEWHMPQRPLEQQQCPGQQWGGGGTKGRGVAEHSPASPVGHTRTTTVLSNGETEVQKGFRDSHNATLGLSVASYNGWLLSYL